MGWVGVLPLTSTGYQLPATAYRSSVGYRLLVIALKTTTTEKPTPSIW